MAITVQAARAVAHPQTQARAAERASHLPALTGLRFVAALWVVLHHFMRHFRPGSVPTTAAFPPLRLVAHLAYDVLHEGSRAVSLFFVLSGFVLAYVYMGEGGMRSSVRAFYVARVARIYPLYLVAMLVSTSMFFFVHGGQPVKEQLLAFALSVTMTQSWVHGFATAWNEPAWSLSVEAFFYLLFPLLACGLARLRGRHLLVALVGCWLLSLDVPLLLLSGARAGTLFADRVLDAVWHLPLLRLPEFAMGMALARLMRRVRPPRWSGGLTWAAAACAGLSVLWIADHPDAGGAPALLAPCWLMVIATCAWGRGCLGALLGSRCFVALGEASYCMYLLHWPVWYWLTALAGLPYTAPANGPAADLPLLFAYTLLTIGVALLAYRTVEQPARRAIRRACA